MLTFSYWSRPSALCFPPPNHWPTFTDAKAGGVYFCLGGPHDGVGRVGLGPPVGVFPLFKLEFSQQKKKFSAEITMSTLPKGQLLPSGNVAFYHSAKTTEELCMKRPARHRNSPMELALRLNPQAQHHCEAFSKHGLWRCERTESQQWPTKALISAQRITMTDRSRPAKGQPRARRGCLLGRGPAVRIADRRRPTWLIPGEAMTKGQPLWPVRPKL